MITIGSTSILLTFAGFITLMIIYLMLFLWINLRIFRMEEDDAKTSAILPTIICSMFTIYWVWKGIFWMFPDVKEFI